MRHGTKMISYVWARDSKAAGVNVRHTGHRCGRGARVEMPVLRQIAAERNY